MKPTLPNPELSVGADNKQWWNQPANRRFGFHNAHRLFRRATMVRSRRVWPLDPAPQPALAGLPQVAALTGAPAFSALVCARGNDILLERCAADFTPDAPHSIQSVTKMHVHLIVGALLARGLIDLSRTVRHYLPEIGSGYAGAAVQQLLDMNVINDFTEDYDDPAADCYAEEEALGWRLPAGDAPEVTLLDFARGITGRDLTNRSGQAVYKSANTDVLTLICARLCPGGLLREVEAIADAAGYAGAFHISLSTEGLPAFSGGGCLGARDLARFGLLMHRVATGAAPGGVGDAGFLRAALERPGLSLAPPRDWVRYSNHLMTDGRFVGHAGYGGQFLMADLQTGVVCAYLSVLENPSGYDEAVMGSIISALKAICDRAAETG